MRRSTSSSSAPRAFGCGTLTGKRYLDCVSAYSAVNLGHCHPRIYAALVEQAGRVTLTSRALRNDRMPGFLEKLTRVVRITTRPCR